MRKGPNVPKTPANDTSSFQGANKTYNTGKAISDNEYSPLLPYLAKHFIGTNAQINKANTFKNTSITKGFFLISH